MFTHIRQLVLSQKCLWPGFNFRKQVPPDELPRVDVPRADAPHGSQPHHHLDTSNTWYLLPGLV